MAECKDVNLSIQPNAFRKLSKPKKQTWHRCYAKHLTRRRNHLKGKQREKKFLKDLIDLHKKKGGVKTRKNQH